MRFNRLKFWNEFRPWYHSATRIGLEQDKVDAIEFLLDHFERDPAWVSVPEIAYALIYMLPTRPIHNLRYLAFRYAEHFSEGFIRRTCSIQVPHFFDLFFCHFSQGRFRPFRDVPICIDVPRSQSPSVSNIFPSRDIFQVFYSIIPFVQIFMINYQPVWTRAKKCFRDKCVRHLALGIATMYTRTKTNAMIRASSIGTSQDVDIADTSQTANIIMFMDGTPSFVRQFFRGKFGNFHSFFRLA